MSTRKKLLQQIEKIIDEGSGLNRRVILQMQMDDSTVKKMMRETSGTMPMPHFRQSTFNPVFSEPLHETINPFFEPSIQKIR